MNGFITSLALALKTKLCLVCPVELISWDIITLATRLRVLKCWWVFVCVELIIGLRPHDTFEFFEFFSRTVNGVFGCWPHLFSIE